MEKEHLEFSGRHMATIRGLERTTSAVGRRLIKELPIGNEGKIRFQNDLPTSDGNISATLKAFCEFPKACI